MMMAARTTTRLRATRFQTALEGGSLDCAAFQFRPPLGRSMLDAFLLRPVDGIKANDVRCAEHALAVVLSSG